MFFQAQEGGSSGVESGPRYTVSAGEGRGLAFERNVGAFVARDGPMGTFQIEEFADLIGRPATDLPRARPRHYPHAQLPGRAGGGRSAVSQIPAFSGEQ